MLNIFLTFNFQVAIKLVNVHYKACMFTGLLVQCLSFGKIGIMYFSNVALCTWKLHDVLWKVLSRGIEHLYSADGSVFLTIMLDSDCSGSFLTRKLVLGNPNA